MSLMRSVVRFAFMVLSRVRDGAIRLYATCLRPFQGAVKAASDEPFIFTEVYRCGKIGSIALSSFARQHPDTKVHVYGTPEDFAYLDSNPNLIFEDISSDKAQLDAFNYGHRGTALLWARLIRERPEKYFIHFDSDVIFRQPVLNDIIKPLHEGYDIVGYIRNYQHNPNKRDDVRHLPDLAQTAFFGFNRTKIDPWPFSVFVKMVQGTYNPYGHPVIDFFDPVMFNILRNNGRIHHLLQEDYGGLNQAGHRDVGPYPQLNSLIDFGKKFIHFSAVGSGMNYYHNSKTTQTVPASYRDYAIEKYALYCRLFYQETIDHPINEETYRALKAVLHRDDMIKKMNGKK